MNKKSIIFAIILGLIILALPLILYYFVTVNEESAPHESNIPTQTKTVDGLTITLRNATDPI
ncbi:hypothetical protein [Paenibacillus taichungensis]|uniref:hypothetical protein n=1 Tax=Paenibacillus taichungensis TaxID=484184 RepID=UPI0039A2586F